MTNIKRVLILLGILFYSHIFAQNLIYGRTIPETVIHDLQNIEHELTNLQNKRQLISLTFPNTGGIDHDLQGGISIWMSHHLKIELDICHPYWGICCVFHYPISDEKLKELIQIQQKLKKYHNMIMENSEDKQTLFILEIMNDFENWLISMREILLKKRKSN